MNMYQSIHHAAGHGLAFARPFASGPHRRPKYNVPLNVTETDTEFEVFVYATGFGKEDITVTVFDDVLTVAGQIRNRRGSSARLPAPGISHQDV